MNKLQIEHLTNSAFTNSGSLKSKEPTIILLYGDFCGHCNQFKPTYRNFVSNTKNRVKHKAIQVDTKIDDEKELVKRLKSIVHSYEGVPTLVLFIGGSIKSVYDGKRTLDDLINWISINNL